MRKSVPLEGWAYGLRPALRVGAFVGTLVAGLSAAQGFCALQPLSPFCCPSPCPVEDGVKILRLAKEANSLAQAAQLGQATAFSYHGLLAGLVADGSRLAGPKISWVDQASFPAPSVGGPMLSAANLDSSASVQFFKIAQKQQLAGLESSTALAVGLASTQRLEDSTAGRRQQALAAARQNAARADLSSNAAVRQSILADLGAFRQMTAAWLAMEATKIGSKLPISAVPAPSGGGQN
ncbi:MAG TPA: hypothetical protein HPP80_11105 [Rhodospirillaceae bacterium]|nr:hypothetical protein [Rhodospirillaceae bacterium]